MDANEAFRASCFWSTEAVDKKFAGWIAEIDFGVEKAAQAGKFFFVMDMKVEYTEIGKLTSLLRYFKSREFTVADETRIVQSGRFHISW